MENKQEPFNYTYSAKQQEEIKQIREKYMPREEDKMARLRKLDDSVTQKGAMWAIIVGVIGSLLLGIGMCCTMVWAETWFIPGIFIGIAGIAVVALAYPVYRYITQRERKKIAPEIIRLTEELMK